MTAAQVSVVPLPESRRRELVDVDLWAFSAGTDDEHTTAGFEWDRTVGAEVDGRLAGVHTTYSLRTSTPGGGSVATGGLSWVGVHPQYRRRGVLSAMIRHHLDAVRDAGEPISSLWAAEPAIYGRFGYGAATTGVRLQLPRRAALLDLAGTGDLEVRLDTADVDRHADEVDACHQQAAAQRPGGVMRQTAQMRRWRFADRPVTRGPMAEPLRLVRVCGPDGDLRAFALFHRDSVWGEAGPAGTVTVREAVTLDAVAARVLWGVLTDLDLSASTTTDSRPHDDPLLLQLVDLRGAAPRVSDGTWVRVVDLPAAVAARTASGALDLVVDVADDLLPANAGTWRLTAAAGEAVEATRTDAPAAVRCRVAEVGSLLLGGHTLLALAGAGRVDVRDGSGLVAASRALAADVAPHCGWVF